MSYYPPFLLSFVKEEYLEGMLSVLAPIGFTCFFFQANGIVGFGGFKFIFPSYFE